MTNKRKAAQVSGQSPKASEAKQQYTEPGYERFLRHLTGVKRQWASKHPRWIAQCPCHEDAEPSFCLEYKLNRWKELRLLGYCHVCGANLESAAEAVGLQLKDVLLKSEVLGLEVGRKPPHSVRLREADILTMAAKLEDADDAFEYLAAKRGLNRKTARRYGLGWDGGVYSLPLYEDGELVTVRRYNPFAPANTPKMRSPLGHSVKHLYPDFPDGSWVLLCEGEWMRLSEGGTNYQRSRRLAA